MKNFRQVQFKAGPMPQRPDLSRLKNPYHLFTAYRRMKLGKTQKDSAAAINEAIKAKFRGAVPKGMSVTQTTIGDFQKPAYVDLASERVRIHLDAMNRVLSSELEGVDVDLADPRKRAELLEIFEYRF